ncbi:MAG: hypothetical protein K0S21_2415 [Rhizobiaceae bacterium]|nr:hypothetical protein [Rhizobiaceae bacterium]
MAPVRIDPGKVHEFGDAQNFYDWLGINHASQDEVWIKIHKVGSGLPSITPKEAIDMALCWGWIDGVRKSFDATSGAQELRRDQLSAALHAASSQKPLEPDQR